MTHCLRGALALLGATFASAPAWGHGFGARYDLPLPLGFYIGGAGAAVALSFVVMAVAAKRAPGVHGYPTRDLLRLRSCRWLAHPALLALVRALAAAAFVFVLAAGFFGSADPFRNILPTMVWVIWWVGGAYIAALIGNVWDLINPWNTLYQCAEFVWRRLGPGTALTRGRPLPPRVGVWPAAVLFAAFAWIELIWEGSDRPASIATAAALYSLVTWAGMFVYGRRRWLKTGEAFTVAFGLFARFAPLYGGRDNGTRTLILRPYAFGLLRREPVSASLGVFALTMLASVTFDGFLETPAWAATVDWALTSPVTVPVLTAFRDAGGNIHSAIGSAGLAVFVLSFAGVYWAFAGLMRRCGGGAQSTARIAGLFVLTLVPIAIAYHLAHYLSFLLVVGQYMVPLSSDPFGIGWDLFDTGTFMIDIGIVDARFVWILSVCAIVVGHIVAVYLAHVMAMRIYGDARPALRSQYPMLVLMVGYTMISLWILAQPIVEA